MNICDFIRGIPREVDSLKQSIVLKTIHPSGHRSLYLETPRLGDQVTYFETPGHSPPMTWSVGQKPVAVPVEEKSAWLDSDGEKVGSSGKQGVDEDNEVEKSRNDVGEEEESLDGHYERVADLHGKLSSDISVDRWKAAHCHTTWFWFLICEASSTIPFLEQLLS